MKCFDEWATLLFTGVREGFPGAVSGQEKGQWVLHVPSRIFEVPIEQIPIACFILEWKNLIRSND